MKPIDADRLLSDLYAKLVMSADVGDVVVRYKDILIVVRNSEELPISYETSLPTHKYRDFNGYVHCSNCNNRITNSTDKYCGSCGKKFIDIKI